MPIVHDPIMVNNTNTDLYATHEAKYGKGGHRTVANIAERNSITFERCEEGMFVLVLADDSDGGKTNLYMLKTNDRDANNRVWEKLNVSGSGTIDPALLDAKLDKSVYDSEKADFATKTELGAKLDTATYDADKANLDTRFDEKLDKSAYDTEKATFALKTELDDKLDVSTYEAEKVDFATKAELGDKANSADVYTKAETDQKIADAVTNGTVDLSNYATKTELGAKLDTATYEAEKADFATKTELGAKLDTSTYEADKANLDTRFAEKLDASTYNADKPTFALKTEVGDLTTLATTEKTSVVGAINEIKGDLDPYDDTQIKADLATAQQEIDALELGLDAKQDKLSETQLQNIDAVPNKANSADVYTKQESDDNYINKSEKAQPKGVATLNAAGKIVPEQLGLSALNLLGEYDATTNTPALQDGTGNQGDFYIVQGEGTQNFGAGDISFLNGDFVIYIDGVWEKSINSNAVVSVNGKTGALDVTAQDIPEIGDLTALNTTAKDTLVNSINEVNTKVDTKTSIDDTQASSTTTYSSNKIDESLALKQDVLAGGPGQIVGFNENGEAISTTQLEFGSSLANVVTSSDFTSKGTLTYTVSDDGRITSSADFYNTFNNATVAPRISFGVVYSLEFTVSRNVHFITLEEDLATGGALILGLGGGDTNPQAPRQGLTGWLMRVENGSVQNLVQYYDTNNAGIQYNFRVGDKIRVVRNDDGYCTLYRTTNANGTFSEWFRTQRKDVFPYKSLGLTFGITQQEFLNNTSFATRDNIVANGVKIQHTHNPDIEFLRDEIAKKEDSNKPYEKFFVVGVWGQSNAVGYDESPITILDFPKYQNRLFQINCRDTNLEFEPLTLVAKNVQDMTGSVGWANDPINVDGRAEFGMENGRYTKGIHLPLANLIADAIPDDYGVIIVPGAYGGQRLDRFLKGDTNSTGAAEGYYARFINAINKAMTQGSQSDKNILGGVIWCQGETDAQNNWVASAYKTAFQNLVNNVKTDLNAYVNQTSNRSLDKLWYVYEFPVHFRNINTGKGILEAQKDIVGDSNYIVVPEDHLTNTTSYTSSTPAAHYGENYFRTFIAPQLFKAMKANGVFSVAGIDDIGNEDELVTIYQYNSLLDRLSMMNELNKNIINLLNSQGTSIETKTRVPFNFMRGAASFEETTNGIRYTGTLGKATFVKYFPTGYNTLYIDVNLVLSNFYGILLGFNPVTKKCLWFFEGQNQIMRSNNIDAATNFEVIEGLGSNFPLGSPGSVKVVRSGTTFTFYRKNFQATEDFPADPSVTVDLSQYFDRIEVTSDTIEWAYGVVVGFTSRFAQANTNLGHFENIFLDDLATI